MRKGKRSNDVEVKEPRRAKRSEITKELAHPPQIKVQPATSEQVDYLAAIRDNDIVIGTGPAGTGKTYLAVLAGMEMLLNKSGRIDCMAIARPIVEAGEKLGYLPGSLEEKSDPYLRPIYDALRDIMPVQCIDAMKKTGRLEIAPLAYMRGRTFKNTFVILDEAQNATLSQLSMILTRLGHGSKVVLTGDFSQVDISRSGLGKLVSILKDTDGIAHAQLTSASNQRHPLVAVIVEKMLQAGQEVS